jgi:hypothetical protein
MKRREFLASSAATAGLAVLGGFSVPKARAQAALPAWVSSQPLWKWFEIPNTQLSSIAPTPTPIGNTGPRSKIETWNGATLQRSGSVYLLGAAGGHADYAGNEVNALRLNTDTPQWVQLRAPTPNASVVDSAQFYLDKRPACTHTYYATQFVEAQSRMLVMPSPGLGMPSAPSPPAGWYPGETRVFSFRTTDNDWDDPDFIAQYTRSAGDDFTACLCVKHQVTEDIYYSRNYAGGWWRYRPSNNSWTKLSGLSRGPWYAGAAMDPTRNRILIMGGYDPGTGPEVRNLDSTSVSASFGGLGASALAVQGYPGAVYDEINDSFMLFYNGGATIAVRRINAATWNVDAPVITGTAPAARVNGIHNSVQFVPELGGIVIANAYDGNVNFLRTASAGVGVAVPDTTPPPSPNLTVK